MPTGRKATAERRWAGAMLLVVVGGMLATAPGPVLAASITTEDVTITSFDATPIAATLYWSDAQPAATARPAILMTHGWAADRGDLDADARWLADQAYVVLAYDSRGFGQSGGVVGLNGPEEWQDASALVDWLAERGNATTAQVRLDGPGDPRVGMHGYSYGGAIQLLAAAHDPRIDAIVPDITWNGLLESLAPATVVKRGWVDVLFWSGVLGSYGATTGSPDAGGMDARLREWYLEALTTGRMPAAAEGPLAERSPSTHLANVSADVLLLQGWQDTLFPPVEAVRTYDVLRAREDAATHLVLHPAGHGRSLTSAERGEVRTLESRFFAAHLDDIEGEPLAPVRFHHLQAAAWRDAAAWPPSDVRTKTVSPAADVALPVTLVQAGGPTSATDTQIGEQVVPLDHLDTPLPTLVNITLDLAAPVTLVGTPQVNATVTPGVADLTLFFGLVDVGPDGAARVVHNQLAPVRIEGLTGTSVTVDLALPSLAWTLQSGHRIVLRVATSDAGYLGAREPGTVTLNAVTVALPVWLDANPLPPAVSNGQGETGSKGSPAPSGFVVVLVMAGAAVAVASGRRR